MIVRFSELGIALGTDQISAAVVSHDGSLLYLVINMKLVCYAISSSYDLLWECDLQRSLTDDFVNLRRSIISHVLPSEQVSVKQALLSHDDKMIAILFLKSTGSQLSVYGLETHETKAPPVYSAEKNEAFAVQANPRLQLAAFVPEQVEMVQTMARPTRKSFLPENCHFLCAGASSIYCVYNTIQPYSLYFNTVFSLRNPRIASRYSLEHASISHATGFTDILSFVSGSRIFFIEAGELSKQTIEVEGSLLPLSFISVGKSNFYSRNTIMDMNNPFIRSKAFIFTLLCSTRGEDNPPMKEKALQPTTTLPIDLVVYVITVYVRGSGYQKFASYTSFPLLQSKYSPDISITEYQLDLTYSSPILNFAISGSNTEPFIVSIPLKDRNAENDAPLSCNILPIYYSNERQAEMLRDLKRKMPTTTHALLFARFLNVEHTPTPTSVIDQSAFERTGVSELDSDKLQFNGVPIFSEKLKLLLYISEKRAVVTSSEPQDAIASCDTYAIDNATLLIITGDEIQTEQSFRQKIAHASRLLTTDSQPPSYLVQRAEDIFVKADVLRGRAHVKCSTAKLLDDIYGSVDGYFSPAVIFACLRLGQLNHIIFSTIGKKATAAEPRATTEHASFQLQDNLRSNNGFMYPNIRSLYTLCKEIILSSAKYLLAYALFMEHLGKSLQSLNEHNNSAELQAIRLFNRIGWSILPLVHSSAKAMRLLINERTTLPEYRKFPQFLQVLATSVHTGIHALILLSSIRSVACCAFPPRQNDANLGVLRGYSNLLSKSMMCSTMLRGTEEDSCSSLGASKGLLDGAWSSHHIVNAAVADILRQTGGMMDSHTDSNERILVNPVYTPGYGFVEVAANLSEQEVRISDVMHSTTLVGFKETMKEFEYIYRPINGLGNNCMYSLSLFASGTSRITPIGSVAALVSKDVLSVLEKDTKKPSFDSMLSQLELRSSTCAVIVVYAMLAGGERGVSCLRAAAALTGAWAGDDGPPGFRERAVYLAARVLFAVDCCYAGPADRDAPDVGALPADELAPLLALPGEGDFLAVQLLDGDALAPADRRLRRALLGAALRALPCVVADPAQPRLSARHWASRLCLLALARGMLPLARALAPHGLDGGEAPGAPVLWPAHPGAGRAELAVRTGVLAAALQGRRGAVSAARAAAVLRAQLARRTPGPAGRRLALLLGELTTKKLVSASIDDTPHIDAVIEPNMKVPTESKLELSTVTSVEASRVSLADAKGFFFTRLLNCAPFSNIETGIIKAYALTRENLWGYLLAFLANTSLAEAINFHSILTMDPDISAPAKNPALAAAMVSFQRVKGSLPRFLLLRYDVVVGPVKHPSVQALNFQNADKTTDISTDILLFSLDPLDHLPSFLAERSSSREHPQQTLDRSLASFDLLTYRSTIPLKPQPNEFDSAEKQKIVAGGNLLGRSSRYSGPDKGDYTEFSVLRAPLSIQKVHSADATQPVFRLKTVTANKFGQPAFNAERYTFAAAKQPNLYTTTAGGVFDTTHDRRRNSALKTEYSVYDANCREAVATRGSDSASGLLNLKGQTNMFSNQFRREDVQHVQPENHQQGILAGREGFKIPLKDPYIPFTEVRDQHGKRVSSGYGQQYLVPAPQPPYLGLKQESTPLEDRPIGIFRRVSGQLASNRRSAGDTRLNSRGPMTVNERSGKTQLVSPWVKNTAFNNDERAAEYAVQPQTKQAINYIHPNKAAEQQDLPEKPWQRRHTGSTSLANRQPKSAFDNITVFAKNKELEYTSQNAAQQNIDQPIQMRRNFERPASYDESEGYRPSDPFVRPAAWQEASEQYYRQEPPRQRVAFEFANQQVLPSNNGLQGIVPYDASSQGRYQNYHQRQEPQRNINHPTQHRYEQEASQPINMLFQSRYQPGSFNLTEKFQYNNPYSTKVSSAPAQNALQGTRFGVNNALAGRQNQFQAEPLFNFPRSEQISDMAPQQNMQLLGYAGRYGNQIKQAAIAKQNTHQRNSDTTIRPKTAFNDNMYNKNIMELSNTSIIPPSSRFANVYSVDKKQVRFQDTDDDQDDDGNGPNVTVSPVASPGLKKDGHAKPRKGIAFNV